MAVNKGKIPIKAKKTTRYISIHDELDHTGQINIFHTGQYVQKKFHDAITQFPAWCVGSLHRHDLLKTVVRNHTFQIKAGVYKK